MKSKIKNIEPFTDYINKLVKYLNNNNIVVYRNEKFEKTDVNLMIRGNLEELFEIKLDESIPNIDLQINLSNDKKKLLNFKNYAQFLLWIYRRIETASILKESASKEDKLYYEEIINQLLQLTEFIKDNFDVNTL
mgnify:FL=1|jgi:hypothetical protein